MWHIDGIANEFDAVTPEDWQVCACSRTTSFLCVVPSTAWACACANSILLPQASVNNLY